MKNINANITNKLFAYVKHGVDVNEDIKKIYENSLIVIGDQNQIYIPAFDTYVGIRKDDFEELAYNGVWVKGEAPYSAQTKGTASVAKGTYSVAEGHESTVIGEASHVEGAENKVEAKYSHGEGFRTFINVAADAAHAEGIWSYASAHAAHAEGAYTFAVGYISHAEGWHSYSIGNYTHSEGRNSYAIGNHSHAEGEETKAIGLDSHAEGKQSYAYGSFSHAEGLQSYAIGSDSHAEGVETYAYGIAAHAEGIGTYAYGSGSHAEGLQSYALGDYSHAEGNAVKAYTISHAEGQNVSAYNLSHAEGFASYAIDYSHAEGEYAYSYTYSHAEGRFSYALNTSHAEGYLSYAFNTSHAEGKKTLAALWSHAEGNNSYAFDTSHVEGYNTYAHTYSHAEGLNTSAYTYSHAEGSYSYAYGQSSHAEGSYSYSLGLNSHAEGYNSYAVGKYGHSEGSETTAYGDSSHAEGRVSYAKGEAAHAEGSFTYATGNDSHSEGLTTYALKAASHAEGHTTYANGQYSHAEGEYSYTLNTAAHAEGQLSYALGTASHAEGYHSYSLKTGSHAEGNTTYANGDYSHVEGQNSYVLGIAAHAEGNTTYALADYSHAEGNHAYARGTASHVEGGDTVAYNATEHAEGRYNISHVTNASNFGNGGNTHHSIGIGTGNDSRKNAVEIMQDGTAYLINLINIPASPIAYYHYDGTNTAYAYSVQKVVNDHINDGLYISQITDPVLTVNDMFAYVLTGINTSENTTDLKHHVSYEVYGVPTKKYVDNLIEANDAMRYCGTVAAASTINGLAELTHYNQGDLGGLINPGHAGNVAPDGSRGAVYKVESAGYIGNAYVLPGDMLISYTDPSAHISFNSTNNRYYTNGTGWNIINENLNLITLTPSYLYNGNSTKNRVLTNVHLNAAGGLSYTYHDLTVYNDTATQDTWQTDLITYNNGGLIHDILRDYSVGNANAKLGFPVITGVSLSQDGTTTHLSYSYSYIFSDRGHHTYNPGINTGRQDMTYASYTYIITGINITYNGNISYTYAGFKLGNSYHADWTTQSYLAYGLNRIEPSTGDTTGVITRLYLNNNSYVSYAYTNLSGTENPHYETVNNYTTYYDFVIGYTQSDIGKVSVQWGRFTNNPTAKDVRMSDSYGYFVSNINISHEGKLSYTYSYIHISDSYSYNQKLTPDGVTKLLVPTFAYTNILTANGYRSYSYNIGTEFGYTYIHNANNLTTAYSYSIIKSYFTKPILTYSTVEFNGETDFYNTVRLHNSRLTLSGNSHLLVNGNTQINGYLVAYGETYLGDATHHTFVNGDLYADKHITSGNKLTVQQGGADIKGDVLLQNDLTVNEDLNVKGNTTLGTNSSYTITLNGHINSDINISYDKNIKWENPNTHAYATVLSYNTSNGVKLTGVNLNANTYIDGNKVEIGTDSHNTYIKGQLEVTNATALKSSLNVTGDTTVNGVTKLNGNTTIGDTLGEDIVTINGNTTVKGTFDTQGTTTLGNEASDAVTINGNTTVKGTFDTQGTTTLGNEASDTVTIKGNTTVNGTFETTKATKLGDDKGDKIEFNGYIGTDIDLAYNKGIRWSKASDSSSYVYGLSYNATEGLKLTGANMNANTYIDGNQINLGTASHNSYVKGNLTVDKSTTLGTSDADALTVKATSTFNENVTINKDLTVNGNTTIGVQSGTDILTINAEIQNNNGVIIFNTDVGITGMSHLWGTLG